MFHEMRIAGIKRKLPLCPVNKDLSIAAFIMFNDVEITVAAAKELLTKVPEFDVIITAESKGIPLAYEMAKQAGNKPYIVARKGVKLYMTNVIETTVNSITTDHIQKLYLGADEQKALVNKKVLIVDDVISTGDSIRSITSLLEKINCDIVGKATVLAEGEAADRKDIIFLEKLPLFNSDGTKK